MVNLKGRRDTILTRRITWSPESNRPPQIGDIARGGYVTKFQSTSQHILHACENCGKQRWIPYGSHLKGKRKLCSLCTRRVGNPPHYLGEKHWNWAGGRHIKKGKYKGYAMIWVHPNDPYASMIDKRGYIPEHRLVMAKHLGRNLQSWEHVHHKNGNKLDNRIDNLELTTNGAHHISHHKGYKDGFSKGYQDGKDKRIKELCLKIKELECQLNQSL